MKCLRRITIFLTVFIVVSCTKSEQFNKRLIKGENWSVKPCLYLPGNEVPAAKISVSSSSFKEGEEYGEGQWKHEDGSEANFFWRFYRSGQEFELVQLDQKPEHEDRAHLQLRNFSGTYVVKNDGKSFFEMTSEETWGYAGKMVSLSWNKQ